MKLAVGSQIVFKLLTVVHLLSLNLLYQSFIAQTITVPGNTFLIMPDNEEGVYEWNHGKERFEKLVYATITGTQLGTYAIVGLSNEDMSCTN